ncbi:MAG: transporter substrate-binding domain-containing protein [Myxococcota bacterium]
MSRRPTAVLAVLLALPLLACAGLGGSPAKQPTALERILARGELRVGMSGEQPPLNMTTKRGELVGLEVALARVLARLIGVELVLEPRPFAGLLGALEAGDIDLAMSGIAITPQRNLRVAFVGPYYVSGKSLLTKSRELLAVKTPAELNREGLRIVALAGSTSEAYVRRHMPRVELSTPIQLSEAVRRVREGEADALLADRETCHFAALRHPGSGLRALGRPFTTEPIGIALPPNEPQLVNLLDNYLRTLEGEGALARARDYWFENDDWIDGLR